ncbi:MAG: type I-U CRISPR-associated protein Cas7 [Betaproteobacteria bacterium]|nr:type I-U CRISPR-associated protein Cas7 [Betaproteobacteria bacterium]
MTDSTPTPLTLDHLKSLVAGDAVAIRGAATLEPAGGAGDKIFPPSHSVDKNERRPGAKYAFEKRRINGGDVDCVLVDSVQSQANRMEEALEALWASKQIALPVIAVDFSGCAPDVGVVTSLSAPHRVADALLRDSLIDGTLFRLSEIGKSFTDATAKNAAPLFKVCPTALVFGLWDSTGPKGGLGSKFARALVSEIIGVGAVAGSKTASRIDPASIVTNAGPVFVAKEPGPDGKPTWTLNVMDAKPLKEGKPPKNDQDVGAVEKWGKAEKAGKPTSINHSNIPPTIDDIAGGVTIDYATHIVVLSLAALQKLGFGGAEVEARTVLAALALLAVLAAEDRGHDLRSRCLLVPKKGEALRLEAVHRDGTTQALSIDLKGAIALFNATVAALPEALRFAKKAGEPLATLIPSPKLAHLVRKSRELAATGAEIEGE